MLEELEEHLRELVPELTFPVVFKVEEERLQRGRGYVVSLLDEELGDGLGVDVHCCCAGACTDGMEGVV